MPEVGFKVKRAATALMRAVMPALCASCGAAVASENALCPACWRSLHVIDRPYCERLGIPLAYDTGEGSISALAARDPPPFARARAACLYGDTAKALVHGLKFNDRLDMVDLMARLMARAGHELTASADLICPVPLHRLRLWQRRFNQPALLAAEVARMTGRTHCPDLVQRVRATRQQVGLSHDQRRANVAGAFAIREVNAMRVHRARVMLVDDVYTTGATVEACVKVLLRAGASAVDVLTFARVAETLENPI